MHGNTISGRGIFLKPKSTPVPEPEPMVRPAEPDPDRPDPVRYGDWELKGVAVDF